MEICHFELCASPPPIWAVGAILWDLEAKKLLIWARSLFKLMLSWDIFNLDNVENAPFNTSTFWKCKPIEKLVVLDCQNIPLLLLDLTEEELLGGYISKMNAGEKPFKVFFTSLKKYRQSRMPAGKKSHWWVSKEKLPHSARNMCPAEREKNWVGTLQNLL